MARTPTSNPNPDQPQEGPSREDEILMREIDDAVRQDDTAEFFQKYGVALGGAFALLIAGMLGYWWWDSSNEAALEAQSETIISALDSTEVLDYAGADAKLEPLLADASIGAKAAAQMVQASNALKQEQPERAVEIYTAIANDEEMPQPLRDMALIREVATNFDDREPADVIAKLQHLAVPGNPFFGSAGELVAIAHLEAGNKEQAGTLFAEISRDEELPASLRNRARQMAGFLGVDAIDDVEKLLEEQAPPAPAAAAQ